MRRSWTRSTRGAAREREKVRAHLSAPFLLSLFFSFSLSLSPNGPWTESTAHRAPRPRLSLNSGPHFFSFPVYSRKQSPSFSKIPFKLQKFISFQPQLQMTPFHLPKFSKNTLFLLALLFWCSFVLFLRVLNLLCCAFRSAAEPEEEPDVEYGGSEPLPSPGKPSLTMLISYMLLKIF